eukprot:TRINITY_DN7808_c0_g1_i4.p1 TRINITY_DN7808_c0_g1~~TRINITY_DN7808_c0_g1_i4.p1  ORF type:complete len:502 (-),score=103.04 TRINITY_DN7808_c0_g1_i4:49-1554(-)
MKFRTATILFVIAAFGLSSYWFFLSTKLNESITHQSYVGLQQQLEVKAHTCPECPKCPVQARVDVAVKDVKQEHESDKTNNTYWSPSPYPPLSRQRLRRDAAPPPPPANMIPSLEPYEEIINKRCPNECSRNGICDRHGKCNCEHGFSGESCEIKGKLVTEYDFKNFPNGPLPYDEFVDEYTCHADEIQALVELELTIFREGFISQELLDECLRVDSKCVRIQIIDNIAYRVSAKPPTPNRWRRWKRLIVSFVRRVKVPDTEFVICFDDRPLIVRHEPLPVFGFYKTDNHNDILIPGDFHHEYFLTGFSEMKIYEQRDNYPWESKKDVAMWRGSPNGIWHFDPYSHGNYHYWPRVRLARLSLHYPDLVDAAFSGDYGDYPKDPRMPPILANYTRSGMPMKDQMKYKYLILVDGNGSSDRFHTFLETSSVVLKPFGPYYEYFQNLPTPYKHYIPIEYDFTDLIDKIKWARDNDDAVKRMAEHGTIWARNHLRFEEIFCYYGK